MPHPLRFESRKRANLCRVSLEPRRNWELVNGEQHSVWFIPTGMKGLPQNVLLNFRLEFPKSDLTIYLPSGKHPLTTRFPCLASDSEYSLAQVQGNHILLNTVTGKSMQFNDLGKAKHENSFSKGHAGIEFFSSPAISSELLTTVHCMFIVCSMLYTCNVNSSNLNFVFVSHHYM